jgi:hypothetical protein
MRTKSASAGGALAILCALTWLAACGEEAPPAPPPVTPADSVPVTPTPTTPAHEVAPPPPAASIPRADVDALLSTWLAAQNAGDFDAYAALYAVRFEGVRRTERETFELDHDGWIEDRRRLFGRPMEVSTSDVEAVLTPSTAIVRFTQRWASGRYVEEGPKQMVLVREQGALRIASEEMIEAHTIAAPPATLGDVLSALETRGSTIVILGEATERGQGAPRELPSDDPRVALREASAAPAAFTALVGREVHLVGDQGACPTTIASIAVAAIVRPHFGTVQQWEGEDFDDSTPPMATAASQIALEIDAMAEHHYWVAVGGASTCGHVSGAVLGGAATIWPRLDRAETLAPVLASIFAGSARPTLVTELREGLEDVGESSGDDAALEAQLRSSVVIHERGTATSSVIEARIPIAGPCGGHERVYLFVRHGDVITRRDVDDLRGIDGVVDVGDGVPELLVGLGSGDTRAVLRLGDTTETLAAWWVSDFDCGC